MEKSTSHFIIQCLKPACRFRFPSSTEIVDPICPKCGSPARQIAYNHQTPVTHNEIKPLKQIDILMDNIRSAYNAGSILRTSDAIKVNHIHLCGTTPSPDNPKVRKTALGAEFSIPWSLHWNALDTVIELKKAGYFILSLELSPQATSIFDMQPDQLGYPLVLVVGNEVTGVDPDILAKSSHILQIPMMGEKGSINVATAFGVAVYFLRYLENKTHPQL
jgi:23S rRNA (guanosine2251-2'-O)-methyltransferase